MIIQGVPEEEENENQYIQIAPALSQQLLLTNIQDSLSYF